MFSNLGKNLAFVPQKSSDREFLLSLYRSTREDELSMTSLSEAQKRVFIKQQFEAKELDYGLKYKEGEFLIIYKKKKPIGRVVYKIDESLRLIDIALVKKSRSQGYGRAILDTLISFANSNNRKFELSVARDNIRALKLYQKIGLSVTGQYSYYYTMQSNKGRF